MSIYPSNADFDLRQGFYRIFIAILSKRFRSNEKSTFTIGKTKDHSNRRTA